MFALLVIAVTLAAPPVAGKPADPGARERALLAEVKPADGFEATLFAAPPAVSYPVFVAAAPDGTLYVSSDKNGSVERKPNRGSVVRLRDTDGDGRADESKRFVPDVDSPRGLVWDRDRLYLLHPPHLSAFIDRDGDGIAEEQKVLVSNIAFGFKDRPADHSSNGVTLGIDGWLYLAIGDFGFMAARGADGRTLQLRGGGVVRVRPDGSGLELFAEGTRNIVEVAVDPRLDAYARDNTNDGDGWDVRLHHFVPLGRHGYPSLYKRFPDEILPAIADYGGGSGCGALFVSEPGLPDGFGEALYTADWGRQRVYRHRPAAKGASFTVDQSELVSLPRPTDLDVDARSRLYVASWKGGVFGYAGEDVGYVVRLTARGHRPPPVPELLHTGAAGLVALLGAPGHRIRLAAQRELLARSLVAEAAPALNAMITDPGQSLDARIAALFTASQGLGKNAHRLLLSAARQPLLRPWALRAIAESDAPATAPLRAGLSDPEPRVRREAVAGLARGGRRADGAAIARLLGDGDPVVRHTAVWALVRLQASGAAFALLDDRRASVMAREGALRALRLIPRGEVVQGLTARLARERTPERRAGLVVALARLHAREGVWKGDSWGTRPDTRGPHYQPEPWPGTPAVARALQLALAAAAPDEARIILDELQRHRVDLDGAIERAVALAGARPDMVPAAMGLIAARDTLPAVARPMLLRVAGAGDTAPATRADAVIALSRLRDPEALQAALAALAALSSHKESGRELPRARQAFLRSPALEAQHDRLEALAVADAGPGAGWAAAGLMALSAGDKVAPEVRSAARKSIEDRWALRAQRPGLLHAAALGQHRPFKDRILEALDDPDLAIAEAARAAASALNLERRGARTKGPLVSTMKPEAVVAAMLGTHGDPARGAELFQRQGCIQCHTVAASEPLRGPYLGNIAATYKRAELTEAILLPSKSLAQGFVSHHFELTDGASHDGFVVREGAGEVVIRTITGEEVTLRSARIKGRGKLERSMMPDGLAANLTLNELAGLLDYLEALARR